jgi:thiol-disulfide isomerase/thioredoxin
MNIKNRIVTYFKTKSPFRITTDLLFYLLILSLILPFSRKYVATGLNKAIMHRPAIIPEEKQEILAVADYDWILLDMEGQKVSFSHFQDEYVFISFWATWCPPCRAEMPNIQNLYNEYGSKISFVLVSHEENNVLNRYLDQNRFDMPVYRMVENPPKILQSSSIPTTYLIDRDGRMIVKKTGAAKWDGRFFKEYLSSKLAK